MSFQENLVQAQRNENVPHTSLLTFHISTAELLVQRPTTEIAMKAQVKAEVLQTVKTKPGNLEK